MRHIRTALVASVLGMTLAAQDRRVVCYVSHDFEHAEVVLKAFEAKTGIRVEAVPDTEDNKTVGLVQRLLSEKGAAKADVFWNNEASQAVRLKQEGVTESYVSPNAAGIPAAFRDPEGHWTGFAARARTIIFNTKLASEADAPKRVEDLADPKFKGKVVMARPLTGSTLTHAAALAASDGLPATVGFLERLIANDVLFEKGNAYVMKQVAEGVRPFGLTDTDDAYVSLDRGDATKSFLPDQGADGRGVLVFPNTAMLVKGAPHPVEARLLIDFLLSADSETMLAAGRAAQIPLRPGVPRPSHVKGLDEIKAFPADWNAVGAGMSDRLKAFENVFAPRAGGLSFAAKATIGALIGSMVAAFLIRTRRSRKTAA